MIRVNLLNDISIAGSSGSTSVAGPDGAGIGESLLQGAMDLGFADSNNVGIGIKLLFLFVPVLLTFGYLQFLVNRAETKRASLRVEKTQAETKLRSFDASLKDIEKFEEEKRKLNSQLAVIKSLSKARLKNVKSLDALQSLIPSSAWLSSLKIIGDKVELEGFAVNDIVVSEFMQQLQTSIFFSHVILSDSTEATTTEGGVKKFRVKCNLENI